MKLKRFRKILTLVLVGRKKFSKRLKMLDLWVAVMPDDGPRLPVHMDGPRLARLAPNTSVKTGTRFKQRPTNPPSSSNMIFH